LSAHSAIPPVEFAAFGYPFFAISRYNEVEEVEPSEWAKAHFFVGFDTTGTMQGAVASKIEEIAKRVADSEGLELVEVEVKGGGAHRLVRISIDKPEGVTHGDCELVSQQVGTILDVEDVVPGGRYTLEVSSPGVERKLLKPQDYQRFQGKKAKITLREPVEGRRHWEGTLAGLEEGMIHLDVEHGKALSFPFAAVEKANLKFEW
jgi:ribosome maturation factor RimP